jgi:hypothetical protein
MIRAQVPQIINYQGRVSVGGTNFDGTGQFMFALINSAGTTNYWSNDGTPVGQPANAVSVPVSSGLYSVALGDTTITNMISVPALVFANSDVWLRIWFNDGINGVQQLVPDRTIASVGYAMMAGSVPAGSITSAQLASNAVTGVNIASNTITAVNLSPGAVTATAIANGAVGASQIATGAVGSTQLAVGAVAATNLAPGVGTVPSGTIVLSPTATNATLTAAGFSPLATITTNIFSSGTNWTEATASAPWSARDTFVALALNGQMYVLGGWSNGSVTDDVWSSSDGANWTQATGAAPWSKRNNSAGVTLNGQMWVLGGYTPSGDLNDVWSSPDGTNWSQATGSAPWHARYDLEAVAFNGQLWVLGGVIPAVHFNDVWSSPDGTNWTEATASAPWSPRGGFGCVVFNGRMWVMGGYGNSVEFSDVWSSPDGTNWTEATASAPWTARDSFVAVAFNGQLWVMGGTPNWVSGRFFNDVWSSPDGTNWTQVTSAAPWSARGGFGAMVLNSQIYVMGGYNGNSGDLNDVWYTAQSSTTTNITTSYISVSPTTNSTFYLYQKQ